MTNPFVPSPTILDGQSTDIYFRRARNVLAQENENPRVTMEFFCRQHAKVCGLREVLALLQRVVQERNECIQPGDITVETLPGDGVWTKPLEPVLRIQAPYRLIADFETPILGMLASHTGWCTAAHKVVEAASGTDDWTLAEPIPIMAMGARHIHPDVSAKMEYAAAVGGVSGVTTDRGMGLASSLDPQEYSNAPVKAQGTMPHALVLCMGDTVAAAYAFDRYAASAVPRVVLVDTFQDEAVEAVRVAHWMEERDVPLWGVRLDTPSDRGGVRPPLVREVRARLDQAGHPDVKIVVSGGMNPERIQEFLVESLHRGVAVDMFGVGSYISGAKPIDFTADIKVVDGRDTAKRGRIPGITENHSLYVKEAPYDDDDY